MNWIPLMDYAVQKGVSLSTLRRRIKANQLTYKVEGGKYLLLLDEEAAMARAKPLVGISTIGMSTPVNLASSPSPELSSRVDKLERELCKTQEEVAELKMLIALYEENLSPSRR